MKVPLSWLRDYVDIIVPVGELAEKLTLAGLEVGDIQTVGGNWDHIIVGRIQGINPHPNADRLRLATVDIGDRERLLGHKSARTQAAYTPQNLQRLKAAIDTIP